MSMNSSLERVENAIDNGYYLRPVKNLHFINKNFEKGTSLHDQNQILKSIDDLEKFPSGITAVALIPSFHEDFLCLDMDFKDETLKTQIWDLLRAYRKEDMFLRIGNRDKFGQLWFKCYDEISDQSHKCLDIIRKSKRCDAIGQYKSESNLEYLWPYKKPWENLPDEFPIISSDLVFKIIKTVNDFFGEETKIINNSRHDAIVKMASLGVNANRSLNDILDSIYQSEEYKSLSLEPKRNANQEVINALTWSVKKYADNYVSYNKNLNEENFNLTNYATPKKPPKVEKNSFFDIIYKAIRRNQTIENKKLAVASTLAVCSWLLTLSVRYKGLAPNLFILCISPSGSGKSSTALPVINEIIKINKKLAQSYAGQDIRTDGAIFSKVQESPIVFYNIDEATKLIKNSKGKSSHTSNVAEILSQLYSDYKDDDFPIALAKLKNESYGVAIGAKACLFLNSTERFLDEFSEENYVQGLGRRLQIFTSSDIPLQKKGKVYNPNYFTRQEKQAITMFLQNYIGNDELYEEQDISEWEILKEVENKNGVKVKNYYKTCKKPKINFELQADDEALNFLNNQFIDDCNDFKIKAAASGSTIQQYFANSRAETILKYTMIHAVCGKKLIAEGDNPLSLGAKIYTRFSMDSISWATDMFNYYTIGSTLEQIDSLYKKDIEIDKSNKIINDFHSKCLEKKILKFKKSDELVRNFFKSIGGSKYRDKIFKEMLARNILKTEGDLNSYGCILELNV